MSDIFAGIDMSDPCAVYPVLEGALNKLLAGAQHAELESRTQIAAVRGVFQRVDIPALRERIDQLRMQCRQKQGLMPGQFAIRGGFR